MAIYIGCAGWNLRKEFAADFPAAGTHLERYAARFNAVEINSSFYRPHRVATYRRWADSTPESFRFAVKLPKQITHISRLVDVESQLDRFTAETAGLGEKLGVILVQAPPSLAFDAITIEPFFRALRALSARPVACEPRHLSWFTPEAESLLTEYQIDRVAADPRITAAASLPGGCQTTIYFRWHGSPRVYYSAYDESTILALSLQLRAAARNGSSAWCIFDNTAEGAALRNALQLDDLLKSET